ncbi:MAG TPA: outer membrane protein assembly factor BamE [Planctomycetaceae bacterium]|nr:outer membrane protein assembly factor BamE [Planctomycetaceae bacterium]
MVRELRRLSRCIIVAALLLIGGCQPERVTKANFDRIEVGMTRAEVEAILGKPTGSYQGILSWTTNHSHTVISIVVDDQGRVSEKSADNL